MKTIKVQPADIKIGDIIVAYGYAMKIESIQISCWTDAEFNAHKHLASDGVTVCDWTASGEHSKWGLKVGDDLACFGFRGSFVEGNREMFDYFRGYISAGPDCGKRYETSYQQGNARAGWYLLDQAA